MNMPALPYLKRIPELNSELLKPAYTAPAVWDDFDPATMTCKNDAEANKLLTRAYRAPFVVPKSV